MFPPACWCHANPISSGLRHGDPHEQRLVGILIPGQHDSGGSVPDRSSSARAALGVITGGSERRVGRDAEHFPVNDFIFKCQAVRDWRYFDVSLLNPAGIPTAAIWKRGCRQQTHRRCLFL